MSSTTEEASLTQHSEDEEDDSFEGEQPLTSVLGEKQNHLTIEVVEEHSGKSTNGQGQILVGQKPGEKENSVQHDLKPSNGPLQL